ncbi:hypothetical protein LOK46_32455 (plasmid) [Methylobacterium sp. NMS14P]|uniref:hypothetical protein n=1 Tax=Methylobacterium sp. NMS14P TaxID=2894310 RepID=UPI00235881DD|nr:hypothetical protein [Methylobacterium sp. NMS14P]WCS28905.1 hypothetical protein LOK46_32455 [Methylobacterium sp. NMS14P]
MSHGLGKSQRLILQALASLEAEHGRDEDLFYVWAIVDRAYALSPEMQGRYRTQNEASATQAAALKVRADAGEELAMRYLHLTRTLTCTRPGARARRTTPFWFTEGDFNPSRVLTSLERRGLVTRRAVRGGGSAGLTDEGRPTAVLLSVGTTLPVAGAADV